MTPSELQALRSLRDAAHVEADSACCCVVGIARMIAQDWRKGQAPGKFALDLLAQLVDDQVEAEAEALRAADAVVAAHDAEVGRVSVEGAAP